MLKRLKRKYLLAGIILVCYLIVGPMLFASVVLSVVFAYSENGIAPASRQERILIFSFLGGGILLGIGVGVFHIRTSIRFPEKLLFRKIYLGAKREHLWFIINQEEEVRLSEKPKLPFPRVGKEFLEEKVEKIDFPSSYHCDLSLETKYGKHPATCEARLFFQVIEGTTPLMLYKKYGRPNVLFRTTREEAAEKLKPFLSKGITFCGGDIESQLKFQVLIKESNLEVSVPYIVSNAELLRVWIHWPPV